jgi:TPR repeat protein/antitoxin component YwqK of YwqJK toxin-antitoxin module
MKTKLLIFLTKIKSLFTLGKKEILKKDLTEDENLTFFEGKPFNGVCVDSHDNGKKESKGHFKDGKRHGLWTDWYYNGKKSHEVHYKDGERHGVHTQWLFDGTKLCEEHYNDGLLDGLSTDWYDDGKKSHEVHYKDGEKHGLSTEWGQFFGLKLSEQYFVNGKQKMDTFCSISEYSISHKIYNRYQSIYLLLVIIASLLGVSTWIFDLDVENTWLKVAFSLCGGGVVFCLGFVKGWEEKEETLWKKAKTLGEKHGLSEGEDSVNGNEQSAEQGNADAQHNLGVVYDNGIGVPQDYLLAHMWFNLSASNGNEDAIEKRNIVEKKMTPSQVEKAQEMTLWKKEKILGEKHGLSEGEDSVDGNEQLAEQGNADAQNDLGFMYDNGIGVPQDYLLAHMWFNLSASNGNEDAIEKRNKVEKKMTPEQIEKAQEMARNWKPKK